MAIHLIEAKGYLTDGEFAQIEKEYPEIIIHASEYFGVSRGQVYGHIYKNRVDGKGFIENVVSKLK